ncbi:MAG: NADH:flavin oxidoreductase/NADH oxidase [Bdellovibrionaceae bacterium]|nr:NADH:flavin oxidoreductase/NADH oxidase [Bdellovibrio sp.]
MNQLFSSFVLRELKFKNRIVVSPMCQYSATEGVPNAWHLVHLGSRAVGGAAAVICEATSVSPEGRISPGDTGIWNEIQISAFLEITEFIKMQNCIPGIQIAHAGRKASTRIPWDPKKTQALTVEEGGWTTLAPSAVPFDANSLMPKEMTEKEIQEVLAQFVQAAKNALQAGFQLAEIHMAHGYLLNEFLSPLSNLRTDQFGGSLEKRMRFPLLVASEIRKVWPAIWPVFARISATDWVEGGWTLQDSIIFCKELKKVGIDLIDCSTGGSSPNAKIPSAPNYQVPFSESIRKESQIATGAVGLITEAQQAEDILRQGQADIILVGRQFLRDPYFASHAARTLNETINRPKQYGRS